MCPNYECVQTNTMSRLGISKYIIFPFYFNFLRGFYKTSLILIFISTLEIWDIMFSFFQHLDKNIFPDILHISF